VLKEIWFTGGVMQEAEIKEKLVEFLSGNIQLDELNEVIDDWLFELRQKPDLTDEQELLSTLELIIHETQEGFRSSDELYATIMNVIELNNSEKTVTTIEFNTSASSEATTIIKGATPVRDYLPGRALV